MWQEHLKDDYLPCVALSSLKTSDFDMVFFPGCHAPMYDLAQDNQMGKWVAEFWEKRGGIVGAVCHGPAAFVAVTLSDGSPFVKGHNVSCFTNKEEKEVDMESSVPFLLENRLRELGANIIAVEPWKSVATTCGRMVTGQNPASATPVGQSMVEAARKVTFK